MAHYHTPPAEQITCQVFGCVPSSEEAFGVSVSVFVGK